jgi:REP element-mobilizing transposase RayT
VPRSKIDLQKHHRRSIRLKGYDYSAGGAFYVTIVTWHRNCIFGQVMDEEMILNDLGKIADECWCTIPEHFPLVELGAYVIMPNHVHGIIVINHNVGATHTCPDRRYWVRRPYAYQIRVQMVHHRVHWVQLWDHSNLPLQNASDANKTPQVSGNAIITNTSSVTKKILKTRPITFMPTPPYGTKMTTTRKTYTTIKRTRI